MSLTDEEKQLAASLGFDEVTADFIKSFSPKLGLSHLQAVDAEGKPVPACALSIMVRQRDLTETVPALRQRLSPAGYQIVRSNCDRFTSHDTVSVLRSDDPNAIVRLKQTNGCNYDIYPEDVITRLEDWNQRFGIEVTGADVDWVEAAFKQAPPDMNAFANEVYEFCPDVVEQGTETVEALAAEMTASGRVFLWWD